MILYFLSIPTKHKYFGSLNLISVLEARFCKLTHDSNFGSETESRCPMKLSLS